MAATLLPLTYHPKHYHKLLPGCQAAHTLELTVRLDHVKIALSEGRKLSWWREVSALGYDGILHAT